jgi:pimeloyl-ACP methyl ester carboxylesterase
LLHVLADAEQRAKAGCGAALLLIAAPFIGEGGWHSDDIRPRTDLAERLPAGMPVFLYQGSEDDTVPFEHLQLHATALPQATIRVLSRRNHQLNDDLAEVARDIRSLGSR